MRKRGWLQDVAVRMAEILEKTGSVIERFECSVSSEAEETAMPQNV